MRRGGFMLTSREIRSIQELMKSINGFAVIVLCGVLAVASSAQTPQQGANDDRTREDEVHTLVNRAVNLLNQDKAEEALGLLRDAERLTSDKASKASIQVNLGSVFIVLKKYTLAVSAFEKAVSLQPNAHTYAGLCQARMLDGQRIEAVEACRESVRLDPSIEEFHVMMADAYGINRRIDEGIQFLEAAYARFENSVRLNGKLADLYYDRSQYDKAAQLYEKVLTLKPSATHIYHNLSLTYDHLDRTTDALRAARTFVEKEPNNIRAYTLLGMMLQNAGFFDESIEPLKKAISMDARSAIAYKYLGEAYEVLGDKENMVPNLAKAYRLSDPDFQMAYKLGDALQDFGRNAEAVAPLERANSLRPNTQYVMNTLGIAYFESNQFDKAVEILTKADRLKPGDKNTTMFLGVAKSRRATLNGFQTVFDRVRQNPKDAEKRVHLAMAYHYRGMDEAAEAEYLNAIRLDPKKVNWYKQLAIFYQETGQLEKALDYSRRSSDLDPNQTYLWSNATILRQLGRLDEAIVELKKSLEVKPAYVNARLDLGDLFDKKGDRAAALREYQTAFDNASGDLRPNFKLAWTYIRMGNKEGAIRHYQILKGITPDKVKYLERSLRAHFGTLN